MVLSYEQSKCVNRRYWSNTKIFQASLSDFKIWFLCRYGYVNPYVGCNFGCISWVLVDVQRWYQQESKQILPTNVSWASLAPTPLQEWAHDQHKHQVLTALALAATRQALFFFLSKFNLRRQASKQSVNYHRLFLSQALWLRTSSSTSMFNSHFFYWIQWATCTSVSAISCH